MRSVLAVGSALASWLALAGAAQAEPLPPCDSTVTTGCVVSVKLDGVDQDYPGTGAPYELSVEELDPGLPWDVNVIVRGEDGAPLPYDGEWEIALNLGGVDPGETFSRGRDVTVVRGGTPASRTITVTLKPVRMAEGPCDSSGVCPALATWLRAGYLEVWIGDLDYLSSPADRAAMRGFDLATNAEWVSSPLQLDYATRAIVLDVANAHWEPLGLDVFVGSAEFRLPFPMLSRLYRVDDPASLTPAAFTVTAASGPAPAVSVDVGASDVKVTMSDLTFSSRKLRIRGDVKPGRPRAVRARRTAAATAVIRFDRALPRGARVRGYRAVCRAGGHVLRREAARPPVRLRGLGAARYSCTLRAKSNAGLGRAAAVAIPRR
jgi:hypothetical protein